MKCKRLVRQQELDSLQEVAGMAIMGPGSSLAVIGDIFILVYRHLRISKTTPKSKY